MIVSLKLKNFTTFSRADSYVRDEGMKGEIHCDGIVGTPRSTWQVERWVVTFDFEVRF